MRHQLPLAVLLLATCTTACTTDGASPDDVAAVTSDLEQVNGGFDTADEVPMFDEELAFNSAALEADATVTDTMSADPEVSTIESAPNGDRIRVLIAWGRMPADPTATTGRDWSGSLTVSRGAVIVGRTIGFEEATDHLLPRTTRDRIDFVSMTRPFADGLALRILDPDRTAADPLTLSYAGNDGSTASVDVRALLAAPARIDMGDGYRVVAIAVRENDACDHGFLRGRWHALREGLGVYRGLVTNEAGEVTGHIRGIWGQRQNGDKVMFGKFIARDGSFRGVVAGTYEAGQFHARWLDRAGDHGLLGGAYVDSPNVRGGVFHGRWAETSCAQ